MKRAISEIYQEIQELNDSDKNELLRTLVAELDAPANSEVEKAWLVEAQRRYRDLVEGRVRGVSGSEVFEHLHSRLRQ